MNDLPTIAANLRKQDSRMTANPLFLVEQKVRRSVPEGYSDTGEWYDTHHVETVTDPCKLADLNSPYSEMLDEPRRYRWVWYLDDWVFVQPFFTERGAQDYIAINGHNLREPRIYVESGWRNAEWELVREHLMALP